MGVESVEENPLGHKVMKFWDDSVKCYFCSLLKDDEKLLEPCSGVRNKQGRWVWKQTFAPCKRHGGEGDRYLSCHECITEGIDKCKCGGHARIFGEALMAGISCDDCDESLMGVGWDLKIRERWNRGERGEIQTVDSGHPI